MWCCRHRHQHRGDGPQLCRRFSPRPHGNHGGDWPPGRSLRPASSSWCVAVGGSCWLPAHVQERVLWECVCGRAVHTCCSGRRHRRPGLRRHQRPAFGWWPTARRPRSSCPTGARELPSASPDAIVILDRRPALRAYPDPLPPTLLLAWVSASPVALVSCARLIWRIPSRHVPLARSTSPSHPPGSRAVFVGANIGGAARLRSLAMHWTAGR